MSTSLGSNGSRAWVALALSILSVASTACPGDPNVCETDEYCQQANTDEDSPLFGQGLSVCVDNFCRECRADVDCGAGQACRNNSCEAIANYCDGTSDCAANEICLGNRCTAGCDVEHGCGEGSECIDNVCREFECNLDSDCPRGSRCQDHACVSGVCADRELETVYFDFDESDVRLDQEARLTANADCLNAFPTDSVRIEGHCDERGTDAYNLALGEQRARASKRYLERLGVAGERLDVISYGEARPTCSAASEACWRQNRRAEFVWR